MAKRVFELARELSVTSKIVLEKCRAEGIDLKNHMSALSAGLEATIREWFSEGATQTAVEVAEHVDLEAARKRAAAQRRRRRKIARAAEEKPAEEKLAAAAAMAEAPAAVAEGEAPAPVGEEHEKLQAEQAAAVVVEEAAPAEAPVAETAPSTEAAEGAAVVEAGIAPERLAEEEKPQEQAPAEGEQPRPQPALRAVPNEPARPEVVAPAGPQVVPKPAKLQGPRVVRFEGAGVVAGTRRPSRAGQAGAPRAGVSTAPVTGKKPARGAAKVGEEQEKPGRTRRRSPRRRSGRTTVEVGEGLREWRDRDLLERSERLAAASGGALRRHRAPVSRGPRERAPTDRTGEVEVEEPITVKGLSSATGIKIGDILRTLMAQGVVATINQVLDHDAAEMIALDYGIALNIKLAKSAEDLLAEELAERKSGELAGRAPIVAFLGHVDHGKTSLLDRIRHAAVAESEDGGITQHIGAYCYDVGDRHVVFLDTPGHEAFTAMRARGANITDMVVLVVAADDGVMPQTVEAISHAKAANVPIVVALNKVDLPNANVQRALGQLAEQGLQPREWGGTTEVIQTSAVTGDGLGDLVETLNLEAELLELQADPNAPASGYVIEAERDPGRGVIVHLLVRDGALRGGDVILCGRGHGRVRTITDDRGRSVEQAGPATPVEVTGLDEVPDAGDQFQMVDSLARAKQVAEERRQRARTETLAPAPQASLESMFDRIEAGEASEIRLIIKADVQGSLEALLGSVVRLGTDEVKVEVLHSGVGGVTEGDVLLAEASEAVILGFRVVPDQRARALAEHTNVEIRTHRVIYELLEELEQAVRGMLAPEIVEQVTGRAEVRAVFKISRLGTVAGCYVTEGMISRNTKVRLIRDNVLIEEERRLDSLKRFKDDVREVRSGLECGIKIAGFDDVKVGDVVEAYQSVEVARSS